MRRLARAAGVSTTTVSSVERNNAEPSLQVLARLAAVLGLQLSVRLYPGTGPLIRDHLQAMMIGALLTILHVRWRPRPEVAINRPVRGVIDLVLEAIDEPLLAL
jgi:transcriptional regulator with XRE-family HTH domain